MNVYIYIYICVCECVSSVERFNYRMSKENAVLKLTKRNLWLWKCVSALSLWTFSNFMQQQKNSGNDVVENFALKHTVWWLMHVCSHRTLENERGRLSDWVNVNARTHNAQNVYIYAKHSRNPAKIEWRERERDRDNNSTEINEMDMVNMENQR